MYLPGWPNFAWLILGLVMRIGVYCINAYVQLAQDLTYAKLGKNLRKITYGNGIKSNTTKQIVTCSYC